MIPSATQRAIAGSVRRVGPCSANYPRARAIARHALGVDRLSSPVARAVDSLVSRVEARLAPHSAPPAASERLGAWLLERYSAEIERRGGETTIESDGGSVALQLLQRWPSERLLLLGCDGWRYYSRRFGSRRVSLRYLCGVDDNGPFAVRVASTVDSIAQALNWLEPAAVQKARAAGKRVLRQGDVYLVESRRDNMDSLPDGHRWNPRTRYLTHHPEDGRKHRPVQCAFRAKAYQQRTYGMGRHGLMQGAD